MVRRVSLDSLIPVVDAREFYSQLQPIRCPIEARGKPATPTVQINNSNSAFPHQFFNAFRATALSHIS